MISLTINNNLKDSDCTAYYLFENDNLKVLQGDIKSSVEAYMKRERFKGEFGEVFSFDKEIQDDIRGIVLLGLGKAEELNCERLRMISGKLLKKAKELKVKTLEIHIPNSLKMSFSETLACTLEGLYLSDYKFTKYKSENKEEPNLKANLLGVAEEEMAGAEKIHEEVKSLTEAVVIARNLINEPANVMTPEVLSDQAKSYGIKYGFEVQVFDKKGIEDLKMEAFLSVAKGSENEPKLIVMRYFGDPGSRENTLGLVGKGLTYDTGGYSLKPTDSMLNMKNDMGGSAAVIGAMCAIAERKLKVNVTAVVAACENMISGRAYKPGDIIGSMAGKTIEIMNTDAEGRLTLADAVCYVVEKENASKVIDAATLTGAALVALGTTATAVITNNEEFFKDLQSASEKSGELVWQLPSFEEYKKLIKSDVADLKNTGGRWAGTITAGLFIGEFVQNKPWLHLDIAGTAWADSDKEYIAKGGTGVGVKTLYHLAKNMSGNK
jgi:leucyl aminopeptidase